MYAEMHDTPAYAKPRVKTRVGTHAKAHAHLRERALPRALGQVWPSAGGCKTASRKKFLSRRRVSRVRCTRAVTEPREFAIVLIIIVSGQTVNRFAYVMNNPLSYTDPSGYFSLKKFFRKILAIAVVVVLGPAGYAPLFSSGLANAAFAGFVSGAVSTGTLKGALHGAFSGALFFGVGELGFAPGGLQNVAAHAAAGCISSVAGGGSCKSGAVAGAFAEAVTPYVPHFDSLAARIAVRAIVGGIGSKLAGGSFEDGAMTGAFGYLFNQMAHQELTSAEKKVLGESYAEAKLALPSDTVLRNVQGYAMVDGVKVNIEIDRVIIDASGQYAKTVEVKYGESASYTPNQRLAAAHIARGDIYLNAPGINSALTVNQQFVARQHVEFGINATRALRSSVMRVRINNGARAMSNWFVNMATGIQ